MYVVAFENEAGQHIEESFASRAAVLARHAELRPLVGHRYLEAFAPEVDGYREPIA